MSQEDFATRASLDRRYLSKVETGKNQVSSYDLRVSLAAGFGLSLEQLSAFIAGSMTMDEAVKHIEARKRAATRAARKQARASTGQA